MQNELETLPDWDKIEETLYEAGLIISENNLRITSHPGPFNKLTSPRASISSEHNKRFRNWARSMIIFI